MSVKSLAGKEKQFIRNNEIKKIEDISTFFLFIDFLFSFINTNVT